MPPALFPRGRTFLLFPTNDAVTVADLVAQRIVASAREQAADSRHVAVKQGDGRAAGACSEADERLVIVVVDSTWAQSKQILRHPSVCGLPTLAVRSHRTAFWRRQTLGENYLSSVEAIYFLCREHDEEWHKQQGQRLREECARDSGGHDVVNDAQKYDNLLVLFAAIRNTIRRRKGGTPCPNESDGGRCTKVSCQFMHVGLDD